MEYVNFGRAGVKVSRLALGMGLRGQADVREAERLVTTAIDRGINLIDCANVYGFMDDRRNIGKSEELLGRVIQGRRHEVVITSKVSSVVGPGPNDHGSSRYHIMREVERSLRRLNTDHIDVYLLHLMDLTTPEEEKYRALDDLVRQGKILYVGVCNYQAWEVVEALWVQERIQAAPLITVQNPYNLLNRTLEREMFPMVRRMGLGLMAYSPLAIGILTGAYDWRTFPTDRLRWGTGKHGVEEAVLRRWVAGVLQELRAVAEEVGATMGQVAQAWILSHPEVTVAISGADNVEQLEENLGALTIQCPPAAWERLNAVSAGLITGLEGPA